MAAFVNKELIYVYRQEQQIMGVKVTGFIGNTHTLAAAVMKHGDDVVKISKMLTDDGSTFEKIEPHNDL